MNGSATRNARAHNTAVVWAASASLVIPSCIEKRGFSDHFSSRNGEGFKTMLRIEADFNNVDSRGRIILFHGDADKSGQVELEEGMHVLLWNEDVGYEVEAVLELASGEMGAIRDSILGPKPVWRARRLPDSGQQRQR